MNKTKLDPKHIQEIIWGNVVVSTRSPNIAREIVIDLHLPKSISGVTVSKACLSGLQAIVQAVQAIEHGDADCIIAGGSDSFSNGEICLPRHLTHALGKYNYKTYKGSNYQQMVQFFKDAGSPLSWLPSQPQIAERSTGKVMGYHADVMAEINQVSREAQDKLAADSHKKAAKARSLGYFDDEVVPVTLPDGKKVTKDTLIRGDTEASKISKLKPVFRPTGTVTAATSSPITDGGSCVLVMSEEKARELGYLTDITIKSIAFSAIDPNPQLLLAPALAIPKALKDANLTLDDIDLLEVHEAFAAQVLATAACLNSKDFAKKFLNQDEPVGKMNLEKLNPNGSSISIGHPFSATGGRIVTSAMNEMRRSNKKYALISICAAGGLGGVVILERNANQSK